MGKHGGLVFALPIFTARATILCRIKTCLWHVLGKEKPPTFVGGILCLRYLFSRPVTRQLSSAYMCLTSVFGMGTGGPTWQSTQTLYWKRSSPSYVKLCIQRSVISCFTKFFLLVTHTGFEPMLTAWEAAVLTTWPMGRWCSFRDSNPGPTD